MKQTSDQITRRLVAQTVVPATRTIPNQLKLPVMEFADGNDGALAAGIPVAATGETPFPSGCLLVQRKVYGMLYGAQTNQRDTEQVGFYATKRRGSLNTSPGNNSLISIIHLHVFNHRITVFQFTCIQTLWFLECISQSYLSDTLKTKQNFTAGECCSPNIMRL